MRGGRVGRGRLGANREMEYWFYFYLVTCPSGVIEVGLVNNLADWKDS